MRYFEKVGFTGSWYEDGTKEVGYRCGHRHKSLDTARMCKVKCNYGHGGEIREYDTSDHKTYIEAYSL